MIVAGIDPGFEGGLAVLNEHRNLETCLMPTVGEGTKRRVNASAVATFLTERDVEHVVIERVGAMPKNGAASMFRFGMGYGQLMGVVAALNYPHEFVTPRKWKGAFGLSKDKEQSRSRILELYPEHAEQFARKKDEGRAEAALIALWRLKQEGAEH
jgi:crossover junction endodeoxyribonuclease RuvC